MVLEFITYISIIFQLLIVITITINSLFGPFLNRKLKFINNSHITNPKVSILVPVRNEEKNIEILIKSITSFDYPDYEIIILDDASTDNTLNLLKNYKSKYQNIKVLMGTKTPDDWLGKNWACYQLSMAASGDILIFTDADNWHRADAISRTIDYMNRFRLDFLSAFPQQITKTIPEKIFVPIVDLIIYSFLILWISFLLKSKAFSAANGQWIAIRKEAYLQSGGHSLVKSSIIDDIQLSREFKKLGFKVMTTAGTDIVFGRMYHNLTDIWNGFSKNMYHILGANPIALSAIILLLFLSGLFPFITLFIKDLYYHSIISLSLILIWKAILSLRFKSNFFLAIIFHPISIFFLIFVAVNSYFKTKSGKIEWKGRKIKLN